MRVNLGSYTLQVRKHLQTKTCPFSDCHAGHHEALEWTLRSPACGTPLSSGAQAFLTGAPPALGLLVVESWTPDAYSVSTEWLALHRRDPGLLTWSSRVRGLLLTKNLYISVADTETKRTALTYCCSDKIKIKSKFTFPVSVKCGHMAVTRGQNEFVDKCLWVLTDSKFFSRNS